MKKILILTMIIFASTIFAGWIIQPVEAGQTAIIYSDSGEGIDSPARANALSRPWTAAEMKAAKPYPMPTLAGADGVFSSDVNAGPTGLPGFAPGARPGQTEAAAMVEAISSDPLSGVSALGYTYPAPFTRLQVGTISPYSTYPFKTIGKLFFKQSGVSYVCSASVIANKAIVTAGHCLHSGNNSTNGWSTNIVFVPAYRNGTAPYGQWPIAAKRVFTDWYANGNPGGFDHDWGAASITVLINSKTIGQTVGYLGYAYNYSRVGSWWLFGYPSSSPFNGMYMYTCQSSYAYDSPFYSGGPAPITVGCDMTGGCSGGPWIRNFGTGNYVNSVNSHRATSQTQSLAGPYADSSTYSTIFAWARAQ